MDLTNITGLLNAAEKQFDAIYAETGSLPPLPPAIRGLIKGLDAAQRVELFKLFASGIFKIDPAAPSAVEDNEQFITTDMLEVSVEQFESLPAAAQVGVLLFLARAAAQRKLVESIVQTASGVAPSMSPGVAGVGATALLYLLFRKRPLVYLGGGVAAYMIAQRNYEEALIEQEVKVAEAVGQMAAQQSEVKVAEAVGQMAAQQSKEVA